MRVSVESTGALERRCTISIPREEIANQMNARFQDMQKTVKLKGFRPGKIPQDHLQKRFGEDVRREVVAKLMDESFAKALEQESLMPVARPRIEDIKDEAESDVEFTAFFEIFPEIELSDLTTIEIAKAEAEITEADVEKMLEKMCLEMADWNPVDRAAALKDRVKVNLSRLLDGEEEPQEHKEIYLNVDGERILQELADALVGMKMDEQKTVELTYPEKWSDKNLAGKKASFDIQIVEVEEQKALDLASLLEKMKDKVSDEAELRELTKTRMTDELNDTVRENMKEAVLDQLLNLHSFELPEALITQEKEAMKQDGQGMGESEDEINENARRRVSLGLLLNEVIKVKQLTPEESRIDDHISRIARQFGAAPEVVKAYYSNEDMLKGVQHSVLLEQAVDAILEEAKVTVETKSFDEIVNGQEDK